MCVLFGCFSRDHNIHSLLLMVHVQLIMSLFPIKQLVTIQVHIPSACPCLTVSLCCSCCMYYIYVYYKPHRAVSKLLLFLLSWGSGFPSGIISLWLEELPLTFYLQCRSFNNEFSLFCLHSWRINLWPIDSFFFWHMKDVVHLSLSPMISDETSAPTWIILL